MKGCWTSSWPTALLLLCYNCYWCPLGSHLYDYWSCCHLSGHPSLWHNVLNLVLCHSNTFLCITSFILPIKSLHSFRVWPSRTWPIYQYMYPFVAQTVYSVNFCSNTFIHEIFLSLSDNVGVSKNSHIVFLLQTHWIDIITQLFKGKSYMVLKIY